MTHPTHRLFHTAPPSLWGPILEGTLLPTPCLNERGDDLLFTALTHPQIQAQARLEAVPRAHRSALATEAEPVLIALAQRSDTNPLATRAWRLGKGKKDPVIEVSNLELAIRLSLTDLAQALLTHPSATLTAVEQALRTPAAWHPAGLLALAVERDLATLVGPMVRTGWNVQQCDAQGLSLVAHAKSAAMVHALVGAGLDPLHLEHPGLVDVLTKRVKRTALPEVLKALSAHARTSVLNDGEEAWHWLRSGKDLDPNHYALESQENAVKALMRRKKEWDRRLEQASTPLRDWTVELKTGPLKGVLTVPAMMARLVQDDHYNVAFSFLRGREKELFGGPAREIAPGVTDYGVWSLWVKSAAGFEDRYIQDPEETPQHVRWVAEVSASLKTIEGLHTPEQWLAWKTQAAVTLSQRPSSVSSQAVRRWANDLAETAVEAGFRDAAQVEDVLRTMDRCLAAGVPLHGGYVTQSLLKSLGNLPSVDEETLGRLQGLRDRVLLACLGTEAKLKNHPSSAGSSASEALKNDARDSFSNDLFLARNAHHLVEDPNLSKLVQKGIDQATALNYPNTDTLRPALTSLLLDQRLPEAQPALSKPRF